MAYLEYDSELITSTQALYTKKAEEMGKIKEAMVNMENNLKLDWETDAGRAFFNHFDNEWMNNFDLYKQTLEHMALLLKDAASCYDDVTSAAESVTL